MDFVFCAKQRKEPNKKESSSVEDLFTAGGVYSCKYRKFNGRQLKDNIEGKGLN